MAADKDSTRSSVMQKLRRCMGRTLATADIAGNKAFDPPSTKAAVILYILLRAFASKYEAASSFAPSENSQSFNLSKGKYAMKVTSDRIKARALQLRKEGFKL